MLVITVSDRDEIRIETPAGPITITRAARKNRGGTGRRLAFAMPDSFRLSHRKSQASEHKPPIDTGHPRHPPGAFGHCDAEVLSDRSRGEV